MTLAEDEWRLDYFHGSYIPKEGEFVAHAQLTDVKLPSDQDTVWTFQRSGLIGLIVLHRRLIWVDFDEGTRCVPYWTKPEHSSNFREIWINPANLVETSFFELRKQAAVMSIRFMAQDFLLRNYDIAVLS